jgi:structural maintenance of chromosome 1
VLIKARNFLVFQGDVEAIASKSPKDLTRLIEQISGSDEFKEEYDRLKELEIKSNEASTYAFNQKRSISNEIKAVQDQKDDAFRYEQLVLQKMDLISEQVMWKLFHVEKEAKTFADSIDALKAEIKTAEQQDASTDQIVKNQRKNLAKVQKDLLAIEKQVKKAQAEADSCAPESLEIDEKFRFVSSKLSGLESSREKLQSSLAKNETDISVIQSQLSEIAESKASFERLAESRAAANQLSPELMAEYLDLKERAAEMTGSERLRLESLDHLMAPTLSTLKHRNEKIEEFQSRLLHLEEEKAPLEGKRPELAKELDVVQDERRALQRELVHLQSERTKLQQAEVETNENLRKCLEKLLQAKIDHEESEREIKLRATVESLRRMFPGVSGRLVELCQPSGKKFENAMTIVLGRHLDSIVVDSEQTAIDCIQYMRKQRAGQATFIPLDTIQARPVAEKWRTFASGARPAIDVINFDQQYLKAFQYACGNALVCDTLEIAKNICYTRSQNVKAVSLDGTVIHKNGFVTGGTGANSVSNKKHSARWEEKDVARLKTERDGFLVSLSEISKSLKRLEGEQKLRTSLSECEARCQFLTEELSAIDRSISTFEGEISHLAENKKQLSKECVQLANSMKKNQVELSKVKETIAAKNEEIFSEFCGKAGIDSIANYEESQAVFSRESSERTAKFTSVMAKLSNQLIFLQKQVEDSRAQLADLVVSIGEETKALSALTREKSVCDAKIQERRKSLQELKKRKEECELSVTEASEQLFLTKKSGQQYISEVSRIKKEISSIECEIDRRLEIRFSLLKKCRLEEIDLPLSRGLLSDISLDGDNHANVSLSGIVVDYTVLGREARQRNDDAFESTYTDRIRELSNEIDSLIPNLRALDKLESVEARLKATMDSFEVARNEFKRARDEFAAVRVKRHERFTTAFKHIATSIATIYKELTRSEAVPNGGTAYLSLEDADEPYNEGIKFNAMPPMKRFLDMEQLSGGERTVAALALLFAIHSFRPAPFFILDEIDAALDNANVQRVAQFIRSKSASTQFIVISLKGSFYEKAESLIGIYRDPSEITSKILSLKLSEYPE